VRPQVQKFLLVVSFAIFLIPTGCASTRSLGYLDAPQGQAFLSPLPHFEDSRFFQKWSGSTNENDKIRYLLNRIAASPNKFMRNGDKFDGRVARQWLLYKRTHWVSGGVKTAEDFISRVAAYSQKTGKPYLVEMPDGKIYSLASVLRNELSALENALLKIRALDRQNVRSGQVSISLSPTAAVAASTN